MMRITMLLSVLLVAGIVMPGCEESTSSSAAADMGVQEGRRPKAKDQRPPPGPAEGSFQEGDDDQVPEDKPDEPSDD